MLGVLLVEYEPYILVEQRPHCVCQSYFDGLINMWNAIENTAVNYLYSILKLFA